MSSKRVHLPLSKVATIVGGGTPSTKNGDNWGGEIPWITPKDLSGFSMVYISRGERSITKQGLQNSSAKLIPPNSILYTSRAPIGYVAINSVQVATNQGFKSLVPKEDFDPFYLYYLLKNSKEIILTHASGGTFAEIGATALGEVELPFPDFKTQVAIGRLLHDLDEKIRLNTEIAKTLEAIAQTIFKSWFIDFDPVHAKSRGEQPEGMDVATAAMFPDSFESTELGPIPKSWTWGNLGVFTEVIDCLHSKKPALLEAGLPYLQLDTISDGGVLRYDKAAKISEQDYRKWTSRIEVTGGDCLVTNVGRVGAVSQIPQGFRAAIGRNITAIRPKRPQETKTFLISLLTSQYMKREISLKTDSGTILDALNVRNIPSLKSPIPPSSVLRCFEESVGPFWAQVHNLYQENVVLGAVRDSLLPRLISGELEIPDELLGE